MLLSYDDLQNFILAKFNLKIGQIVRPSEVWNNLIDLDQYSFMKYFCGVHISHFKDCIIDPDYTMREIFQKPPWEAEPLFDSKVVIKKVVILRKEYDEKDKEGVSIVISAYELNKPPEHEFILIAYHL